MEHRKMRRFKQELGREECERVLGVCTHGVLALCGDGVHPYAVPLNFVYDGNAVWFHSATSGQKLDEIAANPHASFCVIEQDEIVPEEYTSYFRSVMAFGKTEIVTGDNALHGLKMLCVKYSPDLDHTEELAKCGNRVTMFRLNIEYMSGKEAIELVRNRITTPFSDR